MADSRLPAAQQVQPCPPGKSRQENKHASNQPEVEEGTYESSLSTA